METFTWSKFLVFSILYLTVNGLPSPTPISQTPVENQNSHPSVLLNDERSLIEISSELPKWDEILPRDWQLGKLGISRFPLMFRFVSPQAFGQRYVYPGIQKREDGLMVGVADLVSDEMADGRRSVLITKHEKARVRNTMKTSGK